MKIKVWVYITENKLFGVIKSDILKMILEEFKKEGITFPTPKRMVNIKS